jgi:hypothetical protein
MDCLVKLAVKETELITGVQEKWGKIFVRGNPFLHIYAFVAKVKVQTSFMSHICGHGWIKDYWSSTEPNLEILSL